MAKSTCLLALFVAVVVCTEAIRIDVPQPSERPGKFFPSVKNSDPKCQGKKNGLYPIANDCTKYLKCVNGDSQERKCPLDYKFDSIRNCVSPDNNPDCGKKKQSAPLDEDVKCPTTYGMFPIASDCRKYIICTGDGAQIQECPPHYVYRDVNGGCVEGDECPKQASEESVCKRANQLLPDEKNCRRYIKCVNFLPIKKECPPGTAFDPSKSRCTKEQLDKCKNNDGEGSVCKTANEILPDEMNCLAYIKCENFRPIKKMCPRGTAFDNSKKKCTKKQLDGCINNDIRNIGQDE